MPKAEERFFKNAQTWKQISTNVPPEMLKVLKSRVTKEDDVAFAQRADCRVCLDEIWPSAAAELVR